MTLILGADWASVAILSFFNFLFCGTIYFCSGRVGRNFPEMLISTSIAITAIFKSKHFAIIPLYNDIIHATPTSHGTAIFLATILIGLLSLLYVILIPTLAFVLVKIIDRLITKTTKKYMKKTILKEQQESLFY